ncbi:ankyrin [Ustulina deusta]|nr:ankyrin [Ustulina deusta]
MNSASDDQANLRRLDYDNGDKPRCSLQMSLVDGADARKDLYDGDPEDQNKKTMPEGLITLWDSESTAACLDVVVIHGFFGTQRVPWENPGSGSSAWLNDKRPRSFRRVMSFGYDVSILLSGINTQKCIRRLATRLLDSLMNARRESNEKRPTLFLAHDLGGIIAKDALTISSLKPAIYGEISDFTRVVLFYGCPHRVLEFDEIEDKLARFLNRSTPSDESTLTSSARQIGALATAIADINHLFLDSKQTFRSYIFSVFSDSETSAIDKVFDHLTSTMGIPFEIRIAGDSRDIESEIIKHVDRLEFLVQRPGQSIDDERSLIAAAPPLLPLNSSPGPGHSFAWIRENSCYQSWYNQRRPQLLYLFGETDTQPASEFIFYDLDKLHCDRNGQVVVYFTFDRHDIRRDNIRDMLAAVEAQIIGHFPELAGQLRDQMEQHRSDRSFSHRDLLQWFEVYRMCGEFEGVSCVLNHLDECEPTSRRAFLDLMSYISKTQERPCRVLVTSRQPRALSEELRTWPALDLDLLAPTLCQDVNTLSYEYLSRRYPKVRGFKHEVENEMCTISKLDTSAQELVLQRLVQDEQWPSQRSVHNILGTLEEESLDSIVVRVLDGFPEDFHALLALAWILHAARPPTVWELAVILKGSKETNSHDFTSSPISADNIDIFLQKWLAGVISFRQREVLIKTPLIRKALMSELNTTSGKSRLAGSLSPETAHTMIAKFCIDYLSSPTAIASLENLYNESRIPGTHIPWVSDRTSLQDYATQFWLHHLVFSSQAPEPVGCPRINLVAFHKTGAAAAWLKASWVLSNPMTRNERPFESLYPVLVRAGLADEAESWCTADNDVSIALKAACLTGSLQYILSLLPRIKHSTESLQQALVGAGACCNENAWVELISFIHENYPEFPWNTQGSLVRRAAWLCLHEALAKLLEVGCPANEMQPDLLDYRTPLRVAVANNDVDGVKILLKYDDAELKHVYRSGQMLIHDAAVHGHSEMIKLVADHGIDLNAQDNSGCTAIYYACVYGNFKATEVLVALGADVNIKVTNNQAEPAWSPLTCAINEKHIDCTRALLMKDDVNINIDGVQGPPLQYAISNGLLGICQDLLNNGVDPNNHPELPPMLIVAVKAPDCRDKIEIIELLIRKNVRIDDEDGNLNTALGWACGSTDPRQLLIVTLLLEHGAGVNHRNKDGSTPLHFAVAQKNFDLVKLLLEQEGVDVNISDHSNMMPLGLSLGHEEITRLLLKEKANPNSCPKGTESILVQAIRFGHEAVVRLLVQNEAHINVQDELRDDDVLEPMELAIDLGKSDILRILADAGGDVNRRFETDNTSLVHQAVNTNALAALLEFRPEVDVRDDDGNAPLHTVDESTSLENVKLLVRAGANIDITNCLSTTPLFQALARKNEEVADYLIEKNANIKIISPCYGGPLHAACYSGLVNLVNTLIDRGSDINETVAGVGGSPLSSLLQAGSKTIPEEQARTKILEVLLDAGADVAASTGLCFGTVGVAAAWGGSCEHISKLLSHGTSFTAVDAMGRSPLHLAALRGELPIFNSVLAAGDTASERDKCGRGIVSWAAQGGNTEILHNALQLVGDEAINEPDLNGWTPLCWAARGVGAWDLPSDNQQQMVSELLSKGADTTVQSRIKGKKALTPAGIAMYHNCAEEVVRDLIRNKASSSPDVTQEQRETNWRQLVDNGIPCDFCLFECCGILYECENCLDFFFCYKCFDLKDNIHPVDHIFKSSGEEFLPEDGSDASADEIEDKVGSEESWETSDDESEEDSDGDD